MKLLRKDFKNRTGAQASRIVENNLGSQVREKVRKQLGYRVWVRVRFPIWDSLKDKVLEK